jgi:hypothetical protein
MTNVTPRESRVEIPLSELNVQETRWHDLIGEKEWIVENERLSVTLEPYEVVWLKPL